MRPLRRLSRRIVFRPICGIFAALGNSVVTGSTLTNVNDFCAILVTAEGALNA